MKVRWRSVLQDAGASAVGFVVLAALGLGGSARSLSLMTAVVIFGLAALSLGFLWGQVGQVSLCHAAFFGAGAYASAYSADRFGTNVLTGIAIGAVAGSVLAALVSTSLLRVTGHYFVILTFAVNEVFGTLMGRLVSVTGGQTGTMLGSQFVGLDSLDLAPKEQFYLFASAVLIMVMVGAWRVWRSRWGATLRGIRDNPNLAETLGASATRHRIVSFAVSGAVAGIAGHLYLVQVRFIAPDLFGITLSLMFVLMVLLGGRASVVGPLVGAGVYVFLPELATGSPNVAQMVLAVLLIVLILFMPDGIASLATRAVRRLRRPPGVTAPPSELGHGPHAVAEGEGVQDRVGFVGVRAEVERVGADEHA